MTVDSGVSPDPTVPQIEAAVEAATHGWFIPQDVNPIEVWTHDPEPICVATVPAPQSNVAAMADAHLIANAPRYLAFLLERVKELEAEVDAFHGECDKVGVPYNAAVLVRHHRHNAAFGDAMNIRAVELWEARAVAAETRAAELEAERNRAVELLRIVAQPPYATTEVRQRADLVQEFIDSGFAAL